MNKHFALAACLALATPAAFAQTTVETERRVTTVHNSAGSVTTVEETTVVRSYVTYLHGVYTAVGIPEQQIIQLIDLDIQIMEARIRGDWDQVRVYVQRQVDLVGAPVVQRIHTHVQSHPVPASLPIYARPAWVDSVRVQGDDVNINIDANRTEIQRAVEQNNVSVEQLKLDDVRQKVRSGDIEELRVNTDSNTSDNSSGVRRDTTPNAPDSDSPNEGREVQRNTPSQDSDARANPANTDSNNDNATPATTPPARAGETPQAGTTPRSGESPDVENAASPSATPRTGNTPTTNQTPGANQNSQSPNTSATPRTGTSGARSAGTPAANQTPRANHTPAIGTTNRVTPNNGTGTTRDAAPTPRSTLDSSATPASGAAGTTSNNNSGSSANNPANSSPSATGTGSSY